MVMLTVSEHREYIKLNILYLDFTGVIQILILVYIFPTRDENLNKIVEWYQIYLMFSLSIQPIFLLENEN